MKVIIKIFIALIISWVIYCVVDYFTVKNWNNGESLIIKLVNAGPETEIKNDNDENDAFPMLEREIEFIPLSNPEINIDKVKVVRLAGSTLKLIAGKKYLLVWDMFDDGSIQYSVADNFRVSYVVAFIMSVSLILIVITGERGILALLGLIASIAVLIFAMIPLIARGWNPLLLSLCSVLIISVATILCVVRHSGYRLVALFGSLGGTLCGFLVGYVVVKLWQLSGIASDGAALLASTLPGIDMQGILLASVLIGAIGAVLDVGISITASMSEFVDYDPEIALDRLLIAGLNVGNEVLGSMINTLILAYIGSSLPMAVLISSSGINLTGLLNDPYIAQEIVQSLAGTLGLLFTIPATAFAFVIQEGLRRKE